MVSNLAKAMVYNVQSVRAILNTRIGSYPGEAIDPSKPCKWQTRRLGKPRFAVGQHWWVREPGTIVTAWSFIYDADSMECLRSGEDLTGWPSTGHHFPRGIPRAYARIKLEVREIREERLALIKKHPIDWRAEGFDGWKAFANAWNRLHKQDGDKWVDMPKVMVYGFMRVC